MAMGGVDDDDIDARFHQGHGPLEAGVADGRGGPDSSTAAGILWRRRGWASAFSMSLTVIRPTGAIVVVDDDQPLDLCWRSRARRRPGSPLRAR